MKHWQKKTSDFSGIEKAGKLELNLKSNFKLNDG